jgi:DNA processing protein
LLPVDKFSIAVVGTRRPTPYGKITAERFARELCEKGLTIISGLARGIDTIAHTSAVNVNGRTVAVIGSGIDVIYPSENGPLASQIEMQGVIVSEFFMGTTPDPGNFPRRNRIISGMSLGTLVIETSEEGGAMITASTALDQNRELFAIPGHITEKYAAGTNSLIQDGHAKLVLKVEDIIEELEVALRPILKTIPPKPVHIDAVSEQSRLSPSDTLVNLLSLEFKGLIRQMAGKMFVKI